MYYKSFVLKKSKKTGKIGNIDFEFWHFPSIFGGSTEIEERKDFRGTKGTLVKFEKCGFLDFRIKLNIFSRFLEFRFDNGVINCVESKC